MTSRDEYLLLPASRAYIAFTILLAVVLNIMPWGRDYGIPDFLALVLVFWNVHQPRKVGIGIGFLLGLLMDVHSSSALGERALLYSLLCYGAWLMHRRVPWFRIGGHRRAGELFLQWISTMLLWPIADLLLLAPQRRAAERDENRPL